MSYTDAFRAELAARVDRQRTVLRQKMEQLGVEITAEIKIACPVRTGALRNSIRYVLVEGKGIEGVRVMVGDATAFYAPHVEFGTTHESPQPFVRPALLRAERDAPRDIEQAIGEAWI